MNKTLKAIVLLVLLGAVSVVIALPDKTFSWTGPTEYVDGTPIPATDTITYTIKCGNKSGGPYPVEFSASASPLFQDLSALVQNMPGVYYCVAVAHSATYNTSSAYSDQVNFTVTASDLTRVPSKPTALTLR